MFKRNIIVGVLLGSSALYASAENKLSAEILLGMANQEISTSDTSPSGDDISIGFRGAMSLHKNISAEISYHNYGEADDIHIDGFGDTINSKWTTTAFNLGAKGIFPLDNGVSLNARLGISIWDTELKFTDSSIPGQEFKAEDDGTDLYYGIGAEYDINSNMYVGAEYTLTKMNISTADSDVNNLSLSLGYKF
jgi:opacity protein-like surface antigen